MSRVGFLAFPERWPWKTLPVETGRGGCGSSLHPLGNFSVNLRLFQNKKMTRTLTPTRTASGIRQGAGQRKHIRGVCLWARVLQAMLQTPKALDLALPLPRAPACVQMPDLLLVTGLGSPSGGPEARGTAGTAL